MRTQVSHEGVGTENPPINLLENLANSWGALTNDEAKVQALVELRYNKAIDTVTLIGDLMRLQTPMRNDIVKYQMLVSMSDITDDGVPQTADQIVSKNLANSTPEEKTFAEKIIKLAKEQKEHAKETIH